MELADGKTPACPLESRTTCHKGGQRRAQLTGSRKPPNSRALGASQEDPTNPSIRVGVKARLVLAPV